MRGEGLGRAAPQIICRRAVIQHLGMLKRDMIANPEMIKKASGEAGDGLQVLRSKACATSANGAALRVGLRQRGKTLRAIVTARLKP